jgi:apolipoprotein N-acyltransferase
VAANVLLAALLRPRAPRALIAGGLAGLLLLVAAAHSTKSGPSSATLRVGLVQSGEVWSGEPGPEARAQLFERQAALTRQAAEAGALLVAWPSGSVPGSVSLDRDLRVGLSLLAHETGTWLMVGSSAQQKLRGEQAPLAEPANSAWLYSTRGRLAGRYDKRRLLPFDEYVPWRGVAPWPPWIVDPATADFAAGQAPGIFSRGEQRFGVLICWENFFAESFRETAAAGVDFVLSLTNEAFTDSPAAHRQMLAMNVFRAVENRVSIARVAPTGISAVIGPNGAILESLQGVGVLVGELPTNRERSFFTRYGLWFVHLCALANLAALAAAARPQSLQSRPRTARIER